PIDLDFGFPAGSVGVADVNGDNRKDMLVAFGHSSPLGDTLVVFSQTEGRSLALTAALPTDVMPGGGMTTGDLDGDGRADIAIPVNNGIDVFTHVGQSSSPISISLSGVKQLAIADVDGDSHNDIVAVGTFGARVYWGPGPAYSTFTSITTTPAVTSVAAGNLTGHSDGLLDVATSAAPGVNVYRQTGLRAFGAGATHALSGGADIAVGDVTSDSRDDVVASRPASGMLAMLVQNNTGGLVAAADATVAAAPRPVAVADIDHDGANDVVVLHDFAPPGSQPASVGWLRQSSPGVFQAEETFRLNDFAQGYDAKALAIGDVEGDGRDDLVVATSFGLSLLVQNSGVLPTLAPAWITDAFPQSMATNVVGSVQPTITLGRAVTNFGPTKVQLRDEMGAAVASTSGYDSATRKITITPDAPLPSGGYAMHLTGLSDANGATLADAGSTFTVGAAPDETAPQTTLQSPPSGIRSTAPATLSFTADDPGATFWCSFSNEPYRVCGSPQHITAPPGKHAFRVFARDAAGNEDATPAAATWTYRPPVHGYWMLGGAGSIYAFGTAPNLGSASAPRAVDFDISPTGYGYWVVDALGRVFPFGDARSRGNAPALAAGDTVTSISRTATGNGYWLFTARGRVYPFGDAQFYGDMRDTHLNGPVLDSVRTSSGRGYYMVASDGGVFSFGDARFHGSTGAIRLNAPVRSLVPDPDGAGYWLVAVDGGVFAFDAPFRGSMGGAHLNRPVVGMVAFGNGYLMVGADGGIFDFSSKPFLGSLGSHPPTIPIVSVAALG
ncbi:MAG: hypothetical protein QOE62_3076, partial [Actinomycetota bacterium]|nr:hypothetical protein [Actinomycetota bacterium]